MSIPKWNDIASDERFINASQQEQAKIRNDWADDFLRLRDEGDFDLDDKQVSELLTKNGWQPGQVVTALSKRKHERAEQLKQEPDLILPDVRNLLMEKAAQKDGMPLLAGSVADDVEIGFQRVAGTALKSLDFLTGGSIDGLHQAQKEHDAYVRWIDATSQTNTSAIEGWKENGVRGFGKAVLHSSLRELPSFALQIGLGAASGGLATGFMGLSSAADKWADVVDDDSLSFRQKAALIGIHSFYEMVMEQLNTIPLARRLGNKAQGAVFREMIRDKQWKAAAWKAFKQVMGNITEEGAEEFFTQMGQDLSDALIRNGEVTDEDVNNAFNNSVEAFIGGAAMGAIGVGFEGASYLPVDAATSRKYFQQQLGGNLPEKYASKAARQKALDDYELHGTPITAGKPTANDKALAFAERLNAYNHMDDEQRKQYEPYVQEWRDGFDAAMDEKIKEDRTQTIENFDAYRNRVEGEMFTPLNEEGKPVEVVEVKEEEKKPTVTEAVTEPVANETVTETVTEKPAEPPKEEPKQEPKEEPKAQEWTWTAEHPNHEKAPGGHVEIVSADDVVTDSDEGAIDFLQNRNVGAERNGQIIDIAENPNTDLMFVEGLTDKGMPVAIRRDGKLYIVAGMGRTKARRLMGQKQTDAAYLERLKEVAGKHGMSVPEDMKNAFAVRVIDENLTDEQLKDFVRQANMEGGDKLGMDAAERAADDAVGMEKHGDELIGLFRELDNDSIVSASNKEFITKFRDLIGKRDGDVDSNGNPTDQFEKRVANAFLGMLFKNMPVKERSDLLNRLVNHADKYGVVGLYRALAKKSPKLIKLETANKDYGLTDILPNALDALMDFKASRDAFKNDPEMYLNQPRLDGKQLNVDERELFKILAGAKSMAQAARLLQSYVDKARQEISSPLLFGVVRNRSELLMAVNNAAEEITQGGTAADAYMENGTLEDADVPLVEGSVVATDEKPKATRKNPLLRSRAEKTLEPIYMDLSSHPVKDSYVEKIKSAVNDVADKFGVNVVVHRNNNDLPADVQQDLVAFGGNDVAIQAWVDDSDNVVHLVASQMESPEMAVQKMLHEIVGHIGLAALFKGRNTDAWNDMVENLWEHHKNDIRERCKAYLVDFDENTSEGRSELVEEWLARLAETNRKPLWWKTIVSRVRALLRACHVDVVYSDADIQQLLADAATAARRAQEVEPAGKTGNRYSIVKEGTQPLPSGPEPSMAGILQRAAKSPIDTRHLHALRLPLIMELAKQLGSNPKAVDRIAVMGGMAKGVFYEGQERLIKVIRSLVAPHQLGQPIIAENDMVDEQIETIKEYWKGRGIPEDEIEIIENEVEDQPTKTKIVTIWHDKSQAMLRKTLAHEVGHLIDYNAGETTSHGNVLGTVGGIIKGYLKHVIAEDPKNPIDWKAFEKRKRELHKQAEHTIGKRPSDKDAQREWRQKVKDEYSRLLADECDNNGMFRVAVIKDELVQNSAWWRGEWGQDDPNYARYREAPTELFADAMSILLNAPDKFMEQLPETWRMLQNYQSEREDFHKAWQGMMRLMENEDAYADTLLNLAKIGYATDEKTVIQINKEKGSVLRALKRKYVDSFAEVNDASKKMLRSGEAEWGDVPMPAITAAQHQSIKDYYLILAERLAKPLAKAGITDEQIGLYLENQRIVNDPSIKQGHIINPHGLDVHSAELNLQKLRKDLGEEKWQALEDWHKEFWKLRKETIVKMIEQSGMYSKELVQHIKENEWYSYRAVIDQIYNADGTEKPGVGKIYGLKGTFSPIGNPLGWTYDHDLRLMGGILWNVARRDTIEFMKEHYPMLVQKVNAFSRSKNIVPAGYVRMTVLEGNKSVDYNVAEAWALGFTSRLDTDTATILRMFQGITNMYRRVWTMLSPTFLLNNLVRDYLASYQNISGINRNIGVIEWTKCWLQGMKEAFSFNFENKWLGLTGESDIIEEMMKRNMFQSGGKGYDMSERNGLETGSKRMDLLRRYGMIDDAERKNIVRRYADKIGDFIERMVDATEKGAKAGGFLALQRNNKDMSDAERQWHIVRHIGSPDFAQRGTATPITNTLFIFSNAAMQGWNGTLEMAKANPKAFAARWMATTGTAVFIGWLLESGALRDALKGMGADDDDDTIKLLDWLQKMYGKITHYNRYNYMCLPLAERDDGYVWTLRLPFAENSKLPAMLMHGALDEAYTTIKKDKNLMNEIFDAALNQSPNVNPLGGLTRDVMFMLAGKNPRDFLRGREAVKSSEWDAGGMKRLWGSVKYLTHEYTPLPFVNQLFDLRDNPYWWWNVFGSITGMGAWFKPQLYGEAEQNKAVTAEKRRKKLNGKAAVFGGKGK